MPGTGPARRRQGRGLPGLVVPGFVVLGLVVLCLACMAGAWATGAWAQDADRLRPPDRSSPRAALAGFNATTDALFASMAELFRDYAGSTRPFLTSDERRRQRQIMSRSVRAVHYLDVSEISPVLREIIAPERALQLKEVLERIALPAPADIPDAEAVARGGIKRWRVPDTEIDFVLVEDGPQRGQFLVSPATVERLGEFYARVRDLPYRPGPARDLNEVYRAVSQGKTDTIYDAFLGSPIGLQFLIPPRWMLGLPDWARVRLLGTMTWQWFGLVLGGLITWAVLWMARRLTVRLARRDGQEERVRWRSLPLPLAVLATAGVVLPAAFTMLRIGGPPRIALTYLQSGALYLGVAWLAIVGSHILGQVIIASEKLTQGSLDSQLVMLATRSAGIMVALGCLIQGADTLGFPAYSVIAGLGVGGLAVALAARDTVANFLGSMLIMLEKPFRIGHVIRVGGSEGTVETVGFRSTRIRTLDNSLVSIPSSVIVNATVENLTLRPLRRQRFFLQVTYDTPRAALQTLIARIGALLAEHPEVDQKNVQVRFNAFGESSLDILVLFHLSAETYTAELQIREAILMRIMALAEELGIGFAFPTRTVHLAGAGGGDGRAEDGRAGDGRVGDGRVGDGPQNP